MYSTDRAKALDYTLSCLRDMPLYDQCQKTLIVDGKIDIIPFDWNCVQVPRTKDGFCWARMWDAGVGTAIFDNILYLDSDRLLPKNLLQLIVNNIKDNVFLYTRHHFLMLEEVPLKECKKFISYPDVKTALSDINFIGKLKFDPRHGEPFHGPSKNVMSGSTAFTKNTYWKLGGVDHWYCGHGAYADSDFHMQASVAGCELIDLELLELHYPHFKLADNKSPISDEKLYQLSLDNFIYYCNKWKLPMILAERLASRCNIPNPSSYVKRKLASYGKCQ